MLYFNTSNKEKLHTFLPWAVLQGFYNMNLA